MVHLSKKALAFSVAGAFGAVAAAYAIGSHEPQNEARVTCVSQILIPETVEQADFVVIPKRSRADPRHPGQFLNGVFQVLTP